MPDGGEQISVALFQPLIQQRLMVLLDGANQRIVEFHRKPIPTNSTGSLFNFLASLRGFHVLNLAQETGGLTNSFMNFVVDAFLTTYPNNCSDILTRPLPMIAPRQVKRAIEYIRSHPKERHAPSDLASLSGVGVRALQQSFKNVTGQSITEYQISIRLEAARKEILADTDKSIGEIAREWGFYSTSAFGFSFKKAFGMSPSELRKTAT